jgi:Domain of unknown function (DUF1707)
MARDELRVSDADRDRAVTELTGHFEAGRITQAEFDERSSRALEAKTEGDLADLFADLPSRAAPAGPAAGPAAGTSDVPVGPVHVGLPRPMRFGVARIGIAVIAIAALTGALHGAGAHDSRFLLVLVPILVVLAVIRRLSRYR